VNIIHLLRWCFLVLSWQERLIFANWDGGSAPNKHTGSRPRDFHTCTVFRLDLMRSRNMAPGHVESPIMSFITCSVSYEKRGRLIAYHVTRSDITRSVISHKDFYTGPLLNMDPCGDTTWYFWRYNSICVARNWDGKDE
jgi:hypothetical protein